MTVAKGAILMLLFIFLTGCADQFRRQNASAEKEQQEQRKEKDPPTFTYRPGVLAGK